TEQPAENRSDTRSSAPGRRRRRRRSGRQTDRENGEAVLDGIEEYEEEFEAAPQLNLILPDLMDADEAAEVFEELLDRIEHEDAQASATLVDSDPAEILDPDTSEIGEAGDTISSSEPYAFADETSTDTVSLEQAQELDAPESENVADESGLARTRPFGEADWQFLREVVGEYAKPASFAQIHDLLRGARNRMSVTRTNEELRTLTKQAINSGMLARQGKGNRVSYKLAEDMVAAESQPEQVQLVDQMTLIEQAGEADFDQLAEQAPGDPESQPEQVQPLDQMTLIEQASEAELTRDAQEADIDQLLAEQAPGDMLAEGLRDAAELASDPVEARAEVAEMQAEVTGIALEPDNELVGTASIEPEAMVAEPTAPQQRSRRRKQSAVEQTAAPEGVAETASSEEQAQPARSRRRKQAAPVEQAPTAEAEKPKRTRRKAAASEE
ncbi:MAG: hypothetical protein H7Z42_13000, partial [Roseiflexaceae bacterium]|nr:hypothetical protein [Roseiflexaceae bacterium]